MVRSPLSRFTVAAFAVVALMGGVVAGCQSYEMDPVEPKAIAAVVNPQPVIGRGLPPNVLLVIDKSGSMLESATTTGQFCTDDGTNQGTYKPDKPCKWNDLRAAFAAPTTGILITSAEKARWGLMTFPKGDQCDKGTRILDVPNVPNDPNNAQNGAAAVASEIFKVVPGGGTPTAQTLGDALGYMASLPTDNGSRKNFVMLLTDGQPNCNTANAQACTSCLANNSCTNGPCYATFQCDSPANGQGCFDGSGLVDAVKALAAKKIGTFIIGFGKDTTLPHVKAALNEAAAAGNIADESGKKLLSDTFYQANNASELQAALAKFTEVFKQCTFPMNPAPSSDKVVQVVLHDTKGSGDAADVKLAPGTDFKVAADLNSLEIVGTRCDAVSNSEPNRYELRISYASNL